MDFKRVHIIGDLHGNLYTKMTELYLPGMNQWDKNDLLIVTGDAGIVFEGISNKKSYLKECAMLDWFEENKSFTLACVLGNHENYDRIFSNEFPTVSFLGGRAKKIRNNIYFLKNDIYKNEGKTFLVIGGAESSDKNLRTPHIDYWPQEMPSANEILKIKSKLNLYNNKIDYIFTHTCCPSIANHIGNDKKNNKNILTDFLEKISEEVSYKEWYFGHFHIDKTFLNKNHACYCRLQELPKE